MCKGGVCGTCAGATAETSWKLEEEEMTRAVVQAKNLNPPLVHHCHLDSHYVCRKLSNTYGLRPPDANSTAPTCHLCP